VDDVLELCLQAAKESLERQGVPELKKSNLYDMCCYMLALHYYDNRGLLTETEAVMPQGVQAMLWQLRGAADPEGG